MPFVAVGALAVAMKVPAPHGMSDHYWLGTLGSAFDVAASCLALGALWTRPGRSRLLLSGFFIALLSADVAYWHYFYRPFLSAAPGETGIPGLEASKVTSVLYGLSFVVAAAAMLRAASVRRLSYGGPKTIALVTCAALGLAIVPAAPLRDLAKVTPEHAWWEATALVGSLIAIVASLLTIIAARTLRWSTFASGITTLVLSDWTMRAAKWEWWVCSRLPTTSRALTCGGPTSVALLEKAWLFAIVVCAVAAAERDPLADQEGDSEQSLLRSYRVLLCIVIGAPTVLCVLVDVGNGVRLSFGFGVLMHCVNVVSHWLAERIEQFATQAIAVRSAPDVGTDMIPSEFRELFAKVDATHQRLENQAREVDRVSREHQRQREQLERADEEQRRRAHELALLRQIGAELTGPVAGLVKGVSHLPNLPEDKRRVLGDSLGRLHAALTSIVDPALRAPREPEPLAPLLLSLVGQKRLEFAARPQLELDVEVDPAALGACAIVRDDDVLRAISILVDEAVRRAGPCARIRLALAVTDRRIILEVWYRRPGSSVYQLRGGRALSREFDLARQLVAGDCELIEHPERDAVSLVMDRCAPPEWLCTTVPLPGDTRTVVVLDEDATMQARWVQRIGPNLLAARGVELVVLGHASELHAWLAANPAARASTRFLVDQDPQGARDEGLRLVSSLDLVGASTLLSSRIEDRELRGRCRSLDLRMIPKSLIALLSTLDEKG